MTTPQDSINKTERAPRSSGSPPDGPRCASGPERQSNMPPTRSWLWFALILLANFIPFRSLVPGPEAPVEVPYTFFKEEIRARSVAAIYSQGTPSRAASRSRSRTRRETVNPSRCSVA